MSLATAPSPVSIVVGNPSPVATKVSIRPPAIAVSLPFSDVSGKARDAALQTWTVEPSAGEVAWMQLAYNLNNQSQAKKHSSIDAAVDEAIIRYSK